MQSGRDYMAPHLRKQRQGPPPEALSPEILASSDDFDDDLKIEDSDLDIFEDDFDVDGAPDAEPYAGPPESAFDFSADPLRRSCYGAVDDQVNATEPTAPDLTDPGVIVWMPSGTPGGDVPPDHWAKPTSTADIIREMANEHGLPGELTQLAIDTGLSVQEFRKSLALRGIAKH